MPEPNIDAESSISDLFRDADEIEAYLSLVNVARTLLRHNAWYNSTEHRVSRYTPGQIEVLHRFGSLYGFDEGEIDSVLGRVQHSSTLEGSKRPVGEGGAASHSEDVLFHEKRLTETGRTLIDYLAQSVSGDTSQHEANAVMACVGFSPPPDELHDAPYSPERMYVESYLLVRYHFTPIRASEIIQNNLLIREAAILREELRRATEIVKLGDFVHRYIIYMDEHT